MRGYELFQLMGGRGGGKTYRMLKSVIDTPSPDGRPISIICYDILHTRHMSDQYKLLGGDLSKVNFITLTQAFTPGIDIGPRVIDHYALEQYIDEENQVSRLELFKQRRLIHDKIKSMKTRGYARTEGKELIARDDLLNFLNEVG